MRRSISPATMQPHAEFQQTLSEDVPLFCASLLTPAILCLQLGMGGAPGQLKCSHVVPRQMQTCFVLACRSSRFTGLIPHSHALHDSEYYLLASHGTVPSDKQG